MKRFVLVALSAASYACIDSAQSEVRVPLSLAGTAEAASFETPRGYEVELRSAALSFGPLYLCAGATAGKLCETALLEWDDAAVVDLLSDEPEVAGELTGLTGRVRSWMYDLGFVSLLTETRPLVLPAARALDGHSVRLTGTVVVDAVSIPFRVSLAIQQGDQTEAGTQVVRSREGDDLAHEVAAGDALTVRFDAREWFQSANFSLWLEDTTCSQGGPEIVCAGQLEQTCAGDGSVSRERQCALTDEVCIAGKGCVEGVDIEPKSQVGAAIRIDVTSASAPSFTWTRH